MRLISRKRIACVGLVGLIVGCDGGDVAKVATGPAPVVEDVASKKKATRSVQGATPTSSTQVAPE